MDHYPGLRTTIAQKQHFSTKNTVFGPILSQFIHFFFNISHFYPFNNSFNCAEKNIHLKNLFIQTNTKLFIQEKYSLKKTKFFIQR